MIKLGKKGIQRFNVPLYFSTYSTSVVSHNWMKENCTGRKEREEKTRLWGWRVVSRLHIEQSASSAFITRENISQTFLVFPFPNWRAHGKSSFLCSLTHYHLMKKWGAELKPRSSAPLLSPQFQHLPPLLPLLSPPVNWMSSFEHWFHECAVRDMSRTLHMVCINISHDSGQDVLQIVNG